MFNLETLKRNRVHRAIKTYRANDLVPPPEGQNVLFVTPAPFPSLVLFNVKSRPGHVMRPQPGTIWQSQAHGRIEVSL